MLKRERIWFLLLPVLLGMFGLGVARLFQLRFESGDLYPPYSSLRADPLGTRALYEGLENLRGVGVQRFIQPLDKLRAGRNTTLFVLGADALEMSRSTEHEYKTLEQFMFEGGRIVISFGPLNTRPRPKKHPEEDEPGVKTISLKERWKVGLAYEDLPKDADGVYQSVLARKTEDLPGSIVWHTALCFDPAGANWKTIYARDRHPVLIERKFGRGALVLSADSYFLSNEAMRDERRAELLAWLVGANPTVLFDETHLGVIEQPGVAELVRRYRLDGLVIALVLLAGLFVWKNTVRFVPPRAEEEAGNDAVAGKDSAAGFANLLRRSISSSEILSVCLAEWKRTRARGCSDLNAKMEQAAAVIAGEQARPARDRDPVEGYRRISGILAERK